MSNSSDGKVFEQIISADPSGFIAGFQRAVAAANAGSAAIAGTVGKIGDAFKAMQAPLLAISAALAGGAFLKAAITEANKLNSEAMGLAKSLGVTGTQASALRTALDDIGSDSETYIGAFQKFAKQIKTNEDGLNEMGIKTRDANGQLRDSNTLFTEAIARVGSYKPGLDQTTAAMELFGKGVNEVMGLQRLNSKLIDEAIKKNQELGLTMTQEGVESSKAYKAAMNDVGDVFTAIQNVIGQAVMPIFTRLAEWFADIGPSAVFVFKVAINSVATALQGLVWLVKVLWDALSALADPLFTVGRVLRKLISGDVKGATDEMLNMFEHWGSELTGVFDKVVADSQRSWTEVKNLWGGGTEVAAPKGGANTMAKKSTSNRMSQWEADLAAKKVAIEREGLMDGQFREMSKAEELRYWNELKARKGASKEELTAISRKASEIELSLIRETFDVQVKALQAEAEQFKFNTDERLRIEREIQAKYQQGTKEYEESRKRIFAIQRQAAEQEKAIDQSRVEAKRQQQVQVVALEEQAAQQAAQLGIITRGQLLEQERAFEDRRFAIAESALRDRLKVAETGDRNPVEVEKINRELEQLEQQHQLRLGQIKGQLQQDSTSYLRSGIDGIASSFENIVQRIGTQIKSLNDLFRASLSALAQVGMQVIAKMAADWLRQELMMRVFGKASTIGKLGEQSALAGAGGVASMAAAPFPLNLSAPAFGAAMSAAAMAFAPIASAAGGYDIPGSINPLVQAHAREMILPAKHADVIRDMADGGGAGGPPIHLHTQGGDFIHKDDLAGLLRSMKRNFVIT